MSQNVNNVIDFQNQFNSIAEDRKSRFEGTSVVTPEVIEGKVKQLDQIGVVEPREIQGRVVKVQFDEIDHLRRELRTKRYVITVPVDKAAVQDLARDPKGTYAMRCVAAMNRQKDRIIAEAAFADVFTGEDGTTQVAFAADGGREVDATATGLTYAKLLEVKQKQGEVATGTSHDEEAVIAVTDKEAETMLGEDKLTSGDFDRLFMRDENGSLQMALGMKVIEFPSGGNTAPVLNVAAGERACIALAGDSVAFGMQTNPTVEILDLKEQYYETDAVNIIARMGATRREGVRVIKVRTTA